MTDELPVPIDPTPPVEVEADCAEPTGAMTEEAFSVRVRGTAYTWRERNAAARRGRNDRGALAADGEEERG